MNGKFFDLKKEKQDRMINAALKVFALHGYRHASTDDIVKEAGISKGLLFHYFESKLGAYAFVYDYSVRYMTLEMSSVIDTRETEVFTLLKQHEMAKLQVMRNYPYMQQFLNRSLTEDVKEALLTIEKHRETWLLACDKVRAQMDMSQLPAGVDGDKLLKMVDYTVKGLMTERFLDASFQPDMLFEEIAGYLDMMKALTYQ